MLEYITAIPTSRNTMMHADGINSDFYKLLTRSEEPLATAKSNRESEPFDWRAVDQLHNEIDRLSDEMTAMLPAYPQQNTIRSTYTQTW